MSNSRYLALLRHGDYFQRPDVPGAFQPFPLTAKGEQQAENAASLLQKFIGIKSLRYHSTVHCSSLLRAWQTADILVKHIPELKHIESSIELAERCVGSAANLTVSEITEILIKDPRYTAPPEDWKSDSNYRLPFPGAESHLMAGERVSKYLRTLAMKIGSNEMAVVVAHGASIRHASFILGILEMNDVKRLSMHHCHPVFLKISDDDQWSQAGGDWKQRNKLDQPD